MGPYGGHFSVGVRHIGCEAANNGGIGISGWQHEHRDFISHEPQLAGFPERTTGDNAIWAPGNGETYSCNVVFEDSPSRWFDTVLGRQEQPPR